MRVIVCIFDFEINEHVNLKRINDKQSKQNLPVTIWSLSDIKIVSSFQMDITVKQIFGDMTNVFIRSFKNANKIKMNWKYLR